MKRVLYLFLLGVFCFFLSYQNVYSLGKKDKVKKPVTVKVSETETRTFADKAELKKAIKQGMKIFRTKASSKATIEAPNSTNALCGLLVPWNGGAGWNLVSFNYDRDGEPQVPVAADDDAAFGPQNLGFTFNFYGSPFTQCYIGSNGFITFGDHFEKYSADGFPLTGADEAVKMIAGYWEDIETFNRGAGAGLVYWKQESGPGGSWNRFTVLFYKVHYYDQDDPDDNPGWADNRNNTFEIILTDGNDPLIGVGKTVGFSYGDMQWASAYEGIDWDGENGTVGTNAGNGVFFTQLGRFGYSAGNHPLFYNGPYAEDSNVNWLDYQNTDCSLVNGFNVNLDAATGIVLTNPNPGDVLFANSTYDIEWNALGAFNLYIEFSSDGGATWSTVATNLPSTDGGYIWNVPNIVSTTCLLRATSMTDPNVTSTSSMFEIFKPFQFILGNGGERWPVGSQQTISWINNLAPTSAVKNGASLKKGTNGFPDAVNVRLEYSVDGRNGSWIVLAQSILSYFNQINTFLFTAPSSVIYQGLFRLTQVFDSPDSPEGGNEVNGEAQPMVGYSDDYWSTYMNANNGKLLITTPNGGEKLVGNTYYFINWRKTGGIVTGSLLLEYSTDGGLTWNRINSAPIAGVMRYSWLVPKINSTKCLVRVVNYLNRREYDRSDLPFQITYNPEASSSNYPNPFNPSTKIVFNLEKSEFTTLKVFNSIGQEVAVLVNKQLESGAHEFEFNASNLPSGVYFYNLNRGDKSEIHKMLLLK